jgi:cytochrome b561
MRDKYSGLQIGIHWLVFLLVVVAYAPADAPPSARQW